MGDKRIRIGRSEQLAKLWKPYAWDVESVKQLEDTTALMSQRNESYTREIQSSDEEELSSAEDEYPEAYTITSPQNCKSHPSTDEYEAFQDFQLSQSASEDELIVHKPKRKAFDIPTWKYQYSLGKEELRLPYVFPGELKPRKGQSQTVSEYDRLSTSTNSYDNLDAEAESDNFDSPQSAFSPFQFQANTLEHNWTVFGVNDDADLVREFVELYGPMDQESEKFQRLFETFKEQKGEGGKLHDKGNEIEGKLAFPTPVGYDAEFDIYPSVDKVLNGQKYPLHEWFLLPRQDIVKEDIGITRGKSNFNVTLFDPRFKFPDIILGDNDDEAGAEFVYEINKPLRKRFVQLLDEFPLGVTLEKFMHLFQKRNGYFPDYREFCFSGPEEMAKAHSDVFWVLKSPIHETLLFPAYFKSLTLSPVDLFYKTWIRIRYLLSQNKSILLLDSIPKKLFETFGLCINPLDWCFLNNHAFYNFCLKRFLNIRFLGRKRIPISKPPIENPSTLPFTDCRYTKKLKKRYMEWISIEEDFENPRQLLLVELNRKFPLTVEYYERKTGPQRRAVQERKLKEAIEAIPNDYVTPNKNKIKYYEDGIKVGTRMKCLAGWIENPGQFYLNAFTRWNQLEQLMQDMQMHYRAQFMASVEKKYTPKNLQLIEGLHVVARRPTDDKEFYRARILEKIDNETVKVFFIDYGDTITVPRKDVRFLHKEFLTKLEAQAIRCCVKVGRSLRQQFPVTLDGECWTTQEGTRLRILTGNNNLAVSFKQKTIIEEKKIWQVWVHVLKDQSDEIKVHHLEQIVLKSCRDIDPPEDEEADSERHLKIFKFTPVIIPS